MVYRSGMYRIVENRNELLPDGYPGVNGIKTGMTEAAGECLVASAERDGRLVIAAVYDDENRWDDAKNCWTTASPRQKRRRSIKRRWRRSRLSTSGSIICWGGIGMHKVRRFRTGRILAAAAAILLLAFVIRSGYSIWMLREEIAAEEVKSRSS